MKYDLILLLLFLSNLLFAQDNLNDLSYSNIDSLTKLCFQKGAFDKAIPLMQAGRSKSLMEWTKQVLYVRQSCII